MHRKVIVPLVLFAGEQMEDKNDTKKPGLLSIYLTKM
jgi:hypothetical protein